MVDSGAESVNQQWQHPLHRYTLPQAVRDMEIFQSVRDHWLVMRGPAHTWPFRDPLDFASRPLAQSAIAPAITDTDQIIGTGNGSQTKFQLVKTYQVGSQTYTRKIHLPVVASVLVKVAVQGAEVQPPHTVTRYGGQVIFDTPPPAGRLITAGFLFDVEVRFEADNAFDGIVSTFSLGGYADIPLVEVRKC